MKDVKPTYSTGSLIDHVEAKLGGASFSAELKKRRTLLYDLSVTRPGSIPIEVRKFLVLGPPLESARLVLRAAGSAIAGHSMVKHGRFLTEDWAIRNILEQSMYEPLDGFRPDRAMKALAKTEIVYGWRYPWRARTIADEERHWAAVGRPRRSLEELRVQIQLVLRAIDDGDPYEAGRIATNAGQVLRRYPRKGKA